MRRAATGEVGCSYIPNKFGIAITPEFNFFGEFGIELVAVGEHEDTSGPSASRPMQHHVPRDEPEVTFIS